MKILVACEFSGVVRDAFIRAGHDATSVDLLPSESEFGPHIMGDILPILGRGWDLMVAFPPCTYLSYVGNRHWNAPGRAERRRDAIAFFMRLASAPIERIALENPVGCIPKHWRAYDQIVHPYFFGDNYKKRTCLWLQNLPLLKATNMLPKPEPLYYLKTNGKPINRVEGGSKKWKDRSRFHPGMALAMATQRGNV